MKSKHIVLSVLLAGATGFASLSIADHHEGKGEHCPLKGGHMFKKMDADNNGQVSKEEHATFHAKKFEEADADKNGSLSQDEFKAAMKKYREKMKDAKEEMKEKIEGTAE